MPIYEITFKGPPAETHYAAANDPRSAKHRVRQQIEWRDKKEIAHSALGIREMEFNESLTLCGEYRPMTHLVEEWAFLLHDLKENRAEHPGLIYLGQKSVEG